jgi:hypothetical protein
VHEGAAQDRTCSIIGVTRQADQTGSATGGSPTRPNSPSAANSITGASVVIGDDDSGAPFPSRRPPTIPRFGPAAPRAKAKVRKINRMTKLEAYAEEDPYGHGVVHDGQDSRIAAPRRHQDGGRSSSRGFDRASVGDCAVAEHEGV